MQDAGSRLFDRTTGEFKPYHPGKRLTVLDQLQLASAIRSLDADRIKALWTRLNIWPASDMSSLLFWGTIHSIRIGLVNATEAEKRESEEWLRRNGLDVPKRIVRLAQEQARQSSESGT